jgi:DNA-binding GntR family transcriptional regulator
MKQEARRLSIPGSLTSTRVNPLSVADTTNRAVVNGLAPRSIDPSRVEKWASLSSISRRARSRLARPRQARAAGSGDASQEDQAALPIIGQMAAHSNVPTMPLKNSSSSSSASTTARRRKPATTAPVAAGQSASRSIYQVLRQRILDLEMVPGERIVELDIALEHEVSRTPVHEAVQRLAEEGLVEIRQRVGTFVTRIPVDGMEEAMLVRTALEVAIVEKAAARLTPTDVKQLERILDDQRAASKVGDMQRFHQSDEAFHAALADIAGFPGVWRTIQQAKTQVDRFRHLTLTLHGRMDGVIAEHTAVVAALRDGEGHRAADAMRTHLDHVLPVIGMTRAFQPEYFVNQSASGRSRA